MLAREVVVVTLSTVPLRRQTGGHECADLFRAGWFVESLATQTLIIFVIRTAGNPFRSRPSTALLLSVCGSVVAGTLVVLSPLGGALGFAPLPPAFFAALAVMVVGYLVIVQALKRRVYAASGWVPDAR